VVKGDGSGDVGGNGIGVSGVVGMCDGGIGGGIGGISSGVSVGVGYDGRGGY
jgi:hypothetical protein